MPRPTADPDLSRERTLLAALALSAWGPLALALSGVVTLALGGARLRALEPGGDVRLGLLVALLGLATSAWFWRRYASFARARAGRIMDGQRRLYRAKVAVDGVVAAALGAVAVARGGGGPPPSVDARAPMP